MVQPQKSAQAMPEPLRQLVSWRKRLGMDQKSAARVLGIGQGALSEIERGKRFPSLRNALRIERGANIPVEAWVDPSTTTPSTPPEAT
jgi:transcriptional regulator with XRE-family HTH domain